MRKPGYIVDAVFKLTLGALVTTLVIVIVLVLSGVTP